MRITAPMSSAGLDAVATAGCGSSGVILVAV
jgi:hypothetical protein